jgi:hypothetical protein
MAETPFSQCSAGVTASFVSIFRFLSRDKIPIADSPAIRFQTARPAGYPVCSSVGSDPLEADGGLNAFFYAIILLPFLARFNVIAARVRNTFS